VAISVDAVHNSIERLEQWLQSVDYAAYDPFDGLDAWVRPLAIGKLGRQLLLQGVKRFPLNLRPLLGVKPATNSKAMGYFARADLKLLRATGDRLWQGKARGCLEWLKANRSPGYEHWCWGNHTDYQSRVFYLPKGEPTVVGTVHIGHAFLDAWEALGDKSDLEVAEGVCGFIMNDLEHHPEDNGVCISYAPGGYYPVHNASMLAAAVLARTYSHTGDESLRRAARDAVAYTAAAQRTDGSWWYGEADNLRWIDSFHTAYVLDALWWYMASTRDWQHRSAYERGAHFFVESFFLDDGTPKYYADQTYPVDIQCAAQAIETLTLLAREWDESCWMLADRVANWTIAKMQDATGYFYFQRGRGWANKTPMLHWGQATMLNALAFLFLEANRKNQN
jgi:hypothetical protein